VMCLFMLMMSSFSEDGRSRGSFNDKSSRPVQLLIFCDSRGVTPDKTVSDVHIRVYCLVYEPGQEAPLPPLVYVEDMSSNGTWLEATGGDQTRTPLGSGPFLLNDGDILHLGKDTKCVFECKKTDASAFSMTPIQQREIKAREAPASVASFIN
jgi:pSer/pThr/pTyr-binding forkhead associated (FHA) protein